jgi:hypothetical protein
MTRTKHLTIHLGALLAAWLVIDITSAHAQFQAGFTKGGSTTFTPSGNGVRWPITLAPTPGRPLGVSNMMIVPARGTPQYANLNPPTSTIRGTGFAGPGFNLGGFGAVLGGGLDYSGQPLRPSVTGSLGQPENDAPYGGQTYTISVVVPVASSAPYSESAPPIYLGEIPNGANEIDVIVGASLPLIGYLGMDDSRSAAAPVGLQAEVQEILRHSSRLASANIQVATDRGALVLRGIVKDDHERRLAEAMARLTPGVHELRNELVVARLRRLKKS